MFSLFIAILKFCTRKGYSQISIDFFVLLFLKTIENNGKFKNILRIFNFIELDTIYKPLGSRA